VTGRDAVPGFTKVSSCRSCGAPLPPPFLELGETPVANRLLHSPDDAVEEYPLSVAHCPSCSLVQLAYELPAGAIFDADYPYFSSFSDVFVEHARKHVDTLIAERGLDGSSLVVELASNDGYLLKHFVERGIPVLGIEPSAGPAAAARELGVETIGEFFTESLAADLVANGRRADVIIANNVMAHVPDLNGFVAGMRTLIKDNGVITVENPSVVELIRHAEFDTVYHEHYCYFSSLAVDALMRRHGLLLSRIEPFALHGGSQRWWMTPADSPAAAVEPSAADILAAEAAEGVGTAEYYAAFGARVAGIQRDLLALLTELRGSGKRIAAYGAAAKGATLLNSGGIDTSLVDFVVDRNVHKQGRWIPGAGLPILPVEALLERKPDYLLLLAWNFADEIRAQQTEFISSGGQFILPVPEPKVTV
jgi:SAM-dependent methyltransferase